MSFKGQKKCAWQRKVGYVATFWHFSFPQWSRASNWGGDECGQSPFWGWAKAAVEPMLCNGRGRHSPHAQTQSASGLHSTLSQIREESTSAPLFSYSELTPTLPTNASVWSNMHRSVGKKKEHSVGRGKPSWGSTHVQLLKNGAGRSRAVRAPGQAPKWTDNNRHTGYVHIVHTPPTV